MAAPLRPPHRAPMMSSELDGVRALTRALDHYMVDPLLGLVLPGAGDLIGSLLGLYIVSMAIRRRVSPVIIARMLLNLAIDAALGAIPLLGDLFDVAFKANDKNLTLLAERRDTGKATARDWLIVAGAALALAAVLGLVGYVLVAAIRAIAGA